MNHLDREALAHRMIVALKELVSSVMQNNGVGAESINILNELQTILLTLMLPYILPILDFSQQADAETGDIIPIDVFIKQLVLSLTSHPSTLLSYSACLRAYDQTAQNFGANNMPSDKFDFTQKNVTLAFLHALNLIQMRSAFMELTTQLSSSNGSASSLANQMASATAFSVESASRDIQSQLPLLLLKDVINTVLGSANDGISHVAAAVDSLWDSMIAQQKTPAEIVEKAFDLVAPMMGSYLSWEVQILDLMIAADKNPYILDQQGKELVLSADAEKLRQLITSLPTNSRGDNLPLRNYPKLLKQTLKILDVPDKLVGAAGSICAAVSTKSQGSSAVYLSLLTDQSTEQLLNMIGNEDRLQKKLSELDLAMAINLATFPARIAQILSRRALEDPRRTPQCALNQVGGFPNWEQSIINAFTAAQNTFG